MVTAAEAERNQSINPESEMPSAELQTDIKAAPVKSCIRAHFYLFDSLRRAVFESVWVQCGGDTLRALQGSSRTAEHLAIKSPQQLRI